MKMRTGFWLAGLVVMACLLTACSPFGQSQKKVKKTYLLQGQPGHSTPAPVSNQKPCVTLRVSPPGTAPGFRSASMAYVTEPPRLDYFAYHEWAGTPASMIGSLIESRLEAEGTVGAVVSGSTDIYAEVRLDSEVLQLAQEFEAGSSSLLLAIRVRLIDVPHRSLLASRTFSYVEPAAGENPVAGVEAANRAVQDFLDDLAGFLQQSIASIDCG